MVNSLLALTNLQPNVWAMALASFNVLSLYINSYQNMHLQLKRRIQMILDIIRQLMRFSSSNSQ